MALSNQRITVSAVVLEHFKILQTKGDQAASTEESKEQNSSGCQPGTNPWSAFHNGEHLHFAVGALDSHRFICIQVQRRSVEDLFVLSHGKANVK